MALPTIDTAYKPDGALGALFSGFNAANADQSAELELIKQALANQREQSMQPLDTRVRQMEAARADVAASPEMLDAYARGYIGQNNSQDAAGKTALALQPFMQKAGIAKATQEFNTADGLNQLTQLDDIINTDPNPLNRLAAKKQRDRVAGQLKETPEFLQKRELKETGTDSADELRARQAAEAARLRGGASKDPYMEWNKLSPQKRLAIMEWGKVQGINPITREPIKPGEQEAFDQMYAQDAALAAAPVQPKAGSIPIDQVTKGQVPVNEPPPINMRQSSGKVKLSPEERAALIAKIQGK